MKRYLSLLLCLLLAFACLTACGGKDAAVEPGEETEEELREAEQITEVDEDKLKKAGDTLEERLSLLKADGWTEEDGAYVYATKEDDCNGKYIVTAKGNDADVTVSFDYFGDNGDMIDFYKNDPGVGKAVCAYWYLRAVAVLDAPLGNENYKLLVGDTEVVSGSMTYEEAEAVYDEYYED